MSYAGRATPGRDYQTGNVVTMSTPSNVTRMGRPADRREAMEQTRNMSRAISADEARMMNQASGNSHADRLAAMRAKTHQSVKPGANTPQMTHKERMAAMANRTKSNVRSAASSSMSSRGRSNELDDGLSF